MANWDANDMLALLATWQAGDVSAVRHGGDFEACMRGIKAKVLLLPCKTDLYFCVRGLRGVRGEPADGVAWMCL